jgi:hypothetical protein
MTKTTNNEITFVNEQLKAWKMPKSDVLLSFTLTNGDAFRILRSEIFAYGAEGSPEKGATILMVGPGRKPLPVKESLGYVDRAMTIDW